jgi:hypothetical protein
MKFNSIISAVKHAGKQNVHNSYKLLTPFIPSFVKTILKSKRRWQKVQKALSFTLILYSNLFVPRIRWLILYCNHCSLVLRVVWIFLSISFHLNLMLKFKYSHYITWRNLLLLKIKKMIFSTRYGMLSLYCLIRYKDLYKYSFCICSIVSSSSWQKVQKALSFTLILYSNLFVPRIRWLILYFKIVSRCYQPHFTTNKAV